VTFFVYKEKKTKNKKKNKKKNERPFGQKSDIDDM